MKKTLLFALLTMAFLFTGCKQKIEQAPEEVLNAFAKMFPDATHVEWSRQISTFTAIFYHNQHEKQVQFDRKGIWLKTRTEVSIYEVPVPVMTAVRKLSNREIDDVYLFEQSNGAAAYYMMEYNQETPFSTKQIYILTDGTILFRYGWYIPLCYRWHISFRYARHISFCCGWHIDSVAIKEYKGILKEYRDDMVKYAPDKDIFAATDAIDSQAFMKVDPPLFEGDRIL